MGDGHEHRRERDQLSGVWPDPVSRWREPATDPLPGMDKIRRVFGIIILGGLLCWVGLLFDDAIRGMTAPASGCNRFVLALGMLVLAASALDLIALLLELVKRLPESTVGQRYLVPASLLVLPLTAIGWFLTGLSCYPTH